MPTDNLATIGETTIVHPDYEVPFVLTPCDKCGYADKKPDVKLRYTWIDPRDDSPQEFCMGCAHPLPKPYQQSMGRDEAFQRKLKKRRR